MPAFAAPVPILRIFDEEKARAFYEEYLGFSVEWEHRFAPDLPLYMQVRRDALVLHLSEHHGDGTPGTVLYLPMTGIDVFHAEPAARSYRFLRPGIEVADWGARVMELADPFGNRLRFAEPTVGAGA